MKKLCIGSWKKTSFACFWYSFYFRSYVFANIIILISNVTLLSFIYFWLVAILAPQYCHPFVAFASVLIGLNWKPTKSTALFFISLFMQPWENKLKIQNQDKIYLISSNVKRKLANFGPKVEEDKMKYAIVCSFFKYWLI